MGDLLGRTRIRKMTEIKKENEEMAIAILRTRVALLMFTPGLYGVLGVEVEVSSGLFWLSSKIPPSEARPLPCTVFSFCCSFRRNLMDVKVGRVMVHEKCWMGATR